MRGHRELLAPVTDLYAPQSGHRVQKRLSFGIKDSAALGVRNDAITAHLLEKSVVLMSGQVVLDIEATQRRKIGDVCSHEKLSGCFQRQGRARVPVCCQCPGLTTRRSLPTKLRTSG